MQIHISRGTPSLSPSARSFNLWSVIPGLTEVDMFLRLALLAGLKGMLRVFGLQIGSKAVLSAS